MKISVPSSYNIYSYFVRYHSLQFDAADNSHPKADRKTSGGSKHGILKDSSYSSSNNNSNNKGIRQQSVSSNSKYSSSSTSSREPNVAHRGFSNDADEHKISKVIFISLNIIFRRVLVQGMQSLIEIDMYLKSLRLT